MVVRRFSALLLAATAPFVASAQDVPPADGAPLDGTQWAQVSIHERIIIRVPRPIMRSSGRPGAYVAPAPVEWEEHKAPKCIAMTSLTGGALVTRDGDVDLVLAGGQRVRAKLDDCPALDFYSGFYVKPNRDGMLCQDRDVIRSRSGASCPIDKFRSLKPKR